MNKSAQQSPSNPESRSSPSCQTRLHASERSSSPELADHPIAVWERRYRKPLTIEDAREIAENITGFFTVLARWSHEEGNNYSETTANGGSNP